MTQQLKTSVEVDGVWYRPGARAGQEIPYDVVAKIRNPKVWQYTEDGEEPAADTAKPVGAQLATPVDVDGKWYRPGDKIPADVAAKIRNPKAWQDGKLPELAADEDKAAADTTDGGATPPAEEPAAAEPAADDTEETEGRPATRRRRS